MSAEALSITGKRMRLVGQPSLTPAFRAAFHGAQDTFGSSKLTPQRSDRHAAFADAEEGAQIAITSRVKNDTLAIFMVSDALSGLELKLCRHASALT